MSLPEDDDRTVIRPPGNKPAPDASTASPTEPAGYGARGDAAPGGDEDNALPIGTRVGEFEIKGLIGIGGFGIVYLAHDHSLGRDVALKEYLPTSLASRTGGLTVKVKADRHADTFAAGLASFINEARLLAHFDSPSLVKVYRFWNANGTAYMVMPFYQGPTLKQALAEMRTPPSEEWLKALLAPIMGALELLHRENCFHRDVAPDNILLPTGGQPVLLDFGAARRVIEDKKTLTVILKPGFAPVEQYADMPDMRQGAWTDIYALAAVIHYAITGRPPAPSISRIVKDSTVPLEQAAAGSYGESFLKGIDKALAVRPEHRPQSIAELRQLLDLSAAVVAQETVRPPAGNDPSAPARSPALWAGLAATVVVAGAAGGYFVLKGSVPEQQPPVTAQATNASAPATASVTAAFTSAIDKPATAQTSATGSERGAAPAPSMTDVLAQLHGKREPGHLVNVTTDQMKVRIGKDKLKFRIQSDRAGYLYVFMVGTDGDHVNLLFPNSLDANNRIPAGQPLDLPRTGWAMTAGGPPGTNQFVAMVSDAPRDFSKAGLTNTGAFGEFSKERLSSLLRANAAGDAVLAGTTACTGKENCSSAYGAARFSIIEIE